ncbi:MAG: hypothetical protein V2I33_00320, partial [Kangiellaceae bacterium]|nr:hypothetical protein [Kangiellaceae bacterium]
MSCSILNQINYLDSVINLKAGQNSNSNEQCQPQDDYEQAIIDIAHAERTQGAMLKIASLAGHVHQLKEFYNDLHNIIG